MGRGAATGPLGALPGLTWDPARARYFAAAEVLYSVNTSDGQRRYGARYHDIHHFVRMHMYWSGNADCDHWHEGPGFTTSHVGLSLAYERALQAVELLAQHAAPQPVLAGGAAHIEAI